MHNLIMFIRRIIFIVLRLFLNIEVHIRANVDPCRALTCCNHPSVKRCHNIVPDNENNGHQKINNFNIFLSFMRGLEYKQYFKRILLFTPRVENSYFFW